MISSKRTAFVAVAAILLFSASAQAAHLELNGGFETGDFSGWQVFENGGTATISSVNPSEGVYAANLTANGGPFNALIKNANMGIGQVSAGQEINISFDLRGTAAIGGVAFAEVFSEGAGGVSQSELLSGGPLFPAGDPDVWTSYAFTVFLGPDVTNGVTLQLLSACGAEPSCVSDLYFDNVSVTVSSVPVPAALWLFGSALGLLGLRKRQGK